MAKARKSAKRRSNEEGVVPTPLELMAEHAWRRAFLTTYAMSVSFLETQVLPVLEGKDRCEVDVLVDSKGYRDSLFERHSTRVGQDYRLVPMAMPDGCFHPKAALLWGPERGFLAIGSGNLTFGGHGRNLEVFEAFDAAAHPHVFAGFAEFLASLLEVHGDRLPEREPVSRALLAARRLANGAEPGKAADFQPQILHSVRTPILEQIAGIARGIGLGRCLDAIVMSPFFDADGGTVRRLARALDCGRIRVVVPPLAYENRFPFAAAECWEARVEPVVLGAQERRRLHAKVLELRFEAGTLVLTGSVNATHPALGSTRNIEVGVLRYFESAPFPWVPSPKPPGVATDSVEAGDGAGERIVHGVVTKSGRLEGRLLGAVGCSGRWRGSVVAGGETLAEFDLEIDAEGRFSSDDLDVASVLRAGALQLLLTRPGAAARGWLQVEALLAAPRLGRMSSTEILRLSLGKGTEADVMALLEYLARHLVEDTRGRATFRTRGAPGSPEDVLIRPSDLAPRPPAGGAEESEHEDEAGSVLERIRRHLLRRPALAESIEDEGVADDMTDEGGGGRGAGVCAGKPASPAFSITEFSDIMRALSENPKASPSKRAVDLVWWFEGLMTAHLHAREDRSGEAREFLRYWTMKALRDSERGVSARLDGLVAMAAAMTFALGRELAGAAVKQAVLRSAFERWWGGDPDPAAARALLLEQRLSNVVELVGLAEVGRGDNWDATAALAGLLSVVTPDRMVRDALARWRSGAQPHADCPLFATSAGQVFLGRLVALPGGPLPAPEGALPKRVVIGRSGDSACPDCYRTLQGGARELELRGVAACGWCSTIVVRTEV